MKIEHIALWSKNIEKLKNFYIEYFEASPNEGYQNKRTGFSSYFLSFQEGSRLEIMHIKGIKSWKKRKKIKGYCHLAFCVKSKDEVIQLTEKIKKDGYTVLSNPRMTGDGYFESVVLDPDGNEIEITCE